MKNLILEIQELLQSGNLSLAENKLIFLKSTHPSHASTTILQAKLSLKKKQYQKVISLLESHPLLMERPQVLMTLYQAFKATKDNEKAFITLKKAYTFKPRSKGVVNSLIKHLIENEDYAYAIELIDENMTSEESPYEIALLKAQILYKKREINQSLNLLQKLIKLNPDQVEIYIQYLDVLINSGQEMATERILKESRDRFPENINLIKREFQLRLKSNNTSEIESLLVKAASFDDSLFVPYAFAQLEHLSNRNVLRHTGERFEPAMNAEIMLEHMTRYISATHLVKGKTVLDIACGEGYGSYMLSSAASRVIGVDISESTIQSAALKYKKENLEFKVGDCTSIPLSDSSIEVVISFETIEHIIEQDKFIQEIKRVLTPDGLLILSSPNRDIFSSYTGTENEYHLKELNELELRALINPHFEFSKYHSQNIWYGSSLTPLEGESCRTSFHDLNHIAETSDSLPEDFIDIPSQKAIIPKFFVVLASNSDEILKALSVNSYIEPSNMSQLKFLRSGVKKMMEVVFK